MAYWSIVLWSLPIASEMVGPTIFCSQQAGSEGKDIFGSGKLALVITFLVM